MHGLPNHDQGRPIDWGKTSSDYAVYRPALPVSSANWRRSGWGCGATHSRPRLAGPGVLARVFAAQGCRVIGADIAANQIAEAQRLAAEQGAPVEFRVAPAENAGYPASSFDIITAAQSWLYFDKNRAIPEVLRLLARKVV